MVVVKCVSSCILIFSIIFYNFFFMIVCIDIFLIIYSLLLWDLFWEIMICSSRMLLCYTKDTWLICFLWIGRFMCKYLYWSMFGIEVKIEGKFSWIICNFTYKTNLWNFPPIFIPYQTHPKCDAIEAFVVKHSAYVNAHESQHYYMSFTTTKFTLKESCLFREGALLFVSPLC